MQKKEGADVKLLPAIYRFPTDDLSENVWHLVTKFVLIERLHQLIVTEIAATIRQACPFGSATVKVRQFSDSI